MSEALKDAEFRAAIEALADCVIASDASDTVVWANAAAERLLGWRREELIGQPLTAIMPERMRGAHLQGFSRFMHTHQPRIMGRPIRVPALRKDGSEVEIELTLASAKVGERDLVVASLRDLSDRVELERKLASQRLIEAQFQVISLLAQGRQPDEVFPPLLEALCGALDGDVALLWRRRGELLRVEHGHAPGPEFAGLLEKLQAVSLREGEGLPGAVWRDRQPLWVADVQSDARFGRHPLAVPRGLHAALLFPILGRSEPLGVVEFLRRTMRPPSEELLKTVSTLGLQIGQFLERLQMEEELRKSEEWLATTLRSIGDAVIATHPDGTVRFINPVAERLTGHRREEAVGRPLEEIFRIEIEGTGEPAESPTRKVLRERKVMGLSNHAVLVAKDGRRVVIEDAGAPIEGPSGKIEGVVLVFRDGTAHRLAAEERERRLEQEQKGRSEAEGRQRRAELLARAGTVLSSSLDYDVTLNALAQLVVPSHADWCTVHVLEGEAQVPRVVAMAHVDPAKARWARALQKRFPPDPHSPRGTLAVIRTGEPELYPEISEQVLSETALDPELRQILTELKMRSVMIVPLTSRGRTIGAISFVSAESGRHYGDDDLRAAQQLADRAALAIDNARLYLEAQEAIRARDDFLSIASHELRTPLTPLQLQIQALRRKGRQLRDDPEAFAELEERLHSVHRQGQRLARLVNELLDISRISAGKFSLQITAIDLEETVREVVAQLEEMGELKRAKNVIALDLEPGLVGEWDALRLEQIIYNLLTNALKYGGERPIEVSARRKDGNAVLRVVDHGIGIAPEDQQRIFGRFERAVSTRHYGGLGLGLFIVRQVVEAMGGQIQLSSTQGEGSEFTVTLPLVHVEAPVAGE